VADNLTAKGRGRPKGSRNKVTGIAKDIIAEAADRLGGVERLVAWTKEDAQNERAYWSQIFPKLLPLQVGGEDGQAIGIAIFKGLNDNG
jgi:hypothetical protein